VTGACSKVITLACKAAGCPPGFTHQVGTFDNIYECSSDECVADLQGGLICVKAPHFFAGTVSTSALCPTGSHYGQVVLNCDDGNSVAFCVPDTYP
jgi:hypothetical protein